MRVPPSPRAAAAAAAAAGGAAGARARTEIGVPLPHSDLITVSVARVEGVARGQAPQRGGVVWRPARAGGTRAAARARRRRRPLRRAGIALAFHSMRYITFHHIR